MLGASFFSSIKLTRLPYRVGKKKTFVNYKTICNLLLVLLMEASDGVLCASGALIEAVCFFVKLLKSEYHLNAPGSLFSKYRDPGEGKG